jgi:(S)-2-hydroxyglutarate dehydrogenase
MTTCDFLVIGGGIIGLSIARGLRRRHPNARTILIEGARLRRPCQWAQQRGPACGVLLLARQFEGEIHQIGQ